MGKIQHVLQKKTKIKKNFKIGEKYYIYSKGIRAKPDLDSLLVYAGQSGIHHVFIGYGTDWKVTYTDAQLIGKNVKKVC